MKKLKELRNVIFIYLFMYFVHFIIIPYMFQGELNILLATTIITFFGMIYVSYNLLFWFLGFIVYTICANIYIPDALYSIGIEGIFVITYRLEGVSFDILFFSFMIFIFQFLIWIVVVIIKLRKNPNELRNVIFIYIFMYFVHFIFIPFINYENNPNILTITISTITFFGMMYISHNILFWFLGLIVYIICANIYIPEAIYGIGVRGLFVGTYNPESVPIHILIFSGLTFIFQFLIWIAVVIIKFIKRKFFDKNTNKNNEN